MPTVSTSVETECPRKRLHRGVVGSDPNRSVYWMEAGFLEALGRETSR